MPLYVYQCPACGISEERLEHHTAPRIQPCPYCGADVERGPSAGSFRLEPIR